MSRQHGKRKPPARAPARRPAPATPPPVVPADPDAPPRPSNRRKWTAVAVATVLILVSAVGLLIALIAVAAEADGEDVATTTITAPLTLGLVLVPVAFGVLAFVSRHPRPSAATLRATAMAPIAVPIFLLVRDPISAAVAGFGAGGLLALRPEAGVGHRPRIWATGILTLYTAVLAYAIPAAALSVLPLVLPSLVIADNMALRRRERQAELAAKRRA